jgi:uroporphyrinogen decarboxylase
MAAHLTPGERVVRCLSGGDIDYVPYGIGLGWSPWGETLANWRQVTGRPDLEPWREFGFEPSFTTPALEAFVLPHFEPQTIREDAEFVVSRDWRGITMRNRRDGHSMPEFLDYPVKTPADWEKLKAERLRLDTPGRVPQDWAAFRARLQATGEAVQVGWFPWGVFGTPRDLMGAEELLVSFCTEPAMVKDMMTHLTTLWLSLWEQVAAQVQIDHIHIWEDMSGRQGSLISPAMVETFMMPCYDRIVDFARSHGVRVVSVDTDGDCSQLVPVMMKHGVNVFFPFEVQAGNDIRKYRQQYPTLGIMGGLDKRALALTRADVDRELAVAETMVRQGRYVPGFDHLIAPDALWENYRHAAVEMRRICGVPPRPAGNS